MRFSLALMGCEKGAFNKTWIFKGNLKATLKNEVSKVKLTLPTLAGGAEPLEAEGDEASLSGPGELEEKAGGTLAAEEATPRWYNDKNERFAVGTPVNTVIEPVGNATLTYKFEGTEVEISCPSMEGEGAIENLSSKAFGSDIDLTIYKKCTVPKPAGGGCKVRKESFRLATPNPKGGVEGSRLAYKGTTIVDELIGTEISGGLAAITLEACEKAALSKEFKLSGTAVGE